MVHWLSLEGNPQCDVCTTYLASTRFEQIGYEHFITRCPMDVWVCLRKEHVGIEIVCVYFTAVVWAAVLSHRCAPCSGLSGIVNAKIYF
jgi:hypothetical protein